MYIYMCARIELLCKAQIYIFIVKRILVMRSIRLHNILFLLS